MASAAVVTLPTESVVLISISCFRISRASLLEASSAVSAPTAFAATAAPNSPITTVRTMLGMGFFLDRSVRRQNGYAARQLPLYLGPWR